MDNKTSIPATTHLTPMLCTGCLHHVLNHGDGNAGIADGRLILSDSPLPESCRIDEVQRCLVRSIRKEG